MILIVSGLSIIILTDFWIFQNVFKDVHSDNRPNGSGSRLMFNGSKFFAGGHGQGLGSGQHVAFPPPQTRHLLVILGLRWSGALF